MLRKRDRWPAEVGGRLREFLKAAGVTQGECARACGISRPHFNQIVQGASTLRGDLVARLCETYGVNPTWLLTGRGAMFPAQEPAAGGAPSGLSSDALVRELLDRLAQAARPASGGRPASKRPAGPPPRIITMVDNRRAFEEMEGAERFRAIPYMRDAAAAGRGRIVEDDVKGYVVVHERVAARPENLVAVQVAGDSMLPTLTDGSIVAIDVTQNSPAALRGRIVCARTESDEVVIKRLGAVGADLVLTSDNPDQLEYPPISIRPESVENPIIGQVVWGWVDLR